MNRTIVAPFWLIFIIHGLNKYWCHEKTNMYKSTAESSPHQKHQKQSWQLREVHEPLEHEWVLKKKKY